MRDALFAVVVAAAAGMMVGCDSTQTSKDVIESTPTEMVSTGNGRVYLTTPTESSQTVQSTSRQEQPYSLSGQPEQQPETHMGQQTGMHPVPDEAAPSYWAPNAPR